MNHPLTQLDIKNAMVFLNRVDLKGNESEALTDLKLKLQVMGQDLRQAAEAPPETPPETDEGEGNPPLDGKMDSKRG